jgi:hypothetical protein
MKSYTRLSLVLSVGRLETDKKGLYLSSTHRSVSSYLVISVWETMQAIHFVLKTHQFVLMIKVFRNDRSWKKIKYVFLISLFVYDNPLYLVSHSFPLLVDFSIDRLHFGGVSTNRGSDSN